MNCNFDLILKSACKMVNVKCCNGQGFLFRLQNDGGMNSDWSILGGNHSHLLRKGVCSLKKNPGNGRRKSCEVLNFYCPSKKNS
jgi:hypothetical protein